MNARQVSERILDQWEHDKHRVVEAERSLWVADVPTDVLLAREFLRLLCVADQVVASGFVSSPANGVLASAVSEYQQ